MLESKRDRVRHVAALTLQRYTRMFFVRKRYVAFRMKIIRLQAHCRGYLIRYRFSLLPHNISLTRIPQSCLWFHSDTYTFVCGSLQETLCENESESGQIPLSGPHVCKSKEIH